MATLYKYAHQNPNILNQLEKCKPDSSKQRAAFCEGSPCAWVTTTTITKPLTVLSEAPRGHALQNAVQCIPQGHKAGKHR